MNLFFFAEPFAELDLLDAFQNRVDRIASAQRFLNPDLVRNAANIAARHPTLPSPFIRSLLFMNVGDWPSVQDIATRSAVENDRPNYDHRIAARDRNLTNRRIEANPAQYAERGNPITTNPVVDLSWRGAKGVVRSAFTLFDSAFDEFANAPVREAVEDYREEGIGQALGGLAESFNPTTGFGIGTSRAGSDQQGRSPLGLLVKQYVNGEDPGPINLGSGFFPGEQPREEGMSDQQYISKYGLPINTLSHQQREELQIGNRFGVSTAVSPGRLVFNNIVEPGTRPHNLLSGLTDMAWNIVADPTSIVGKPISAARQAGKVFRASHGLIDDASRLTIDGVNARSWINTSEGDAVAVILANRDKLTDIRGLLPEVKDRKLLDALRAAKDPQAIKDLLSPHLGTDITRIPYSGGWMRRLTGLPTVGELTSHLPFTDPDMARIAGFLPSVSRQFQSTRIGRFFQRRPGLHISADNLDQAFDDVDSWMRNVGLSDEAREVHLRRWAQVQDGNGTQMYDAARALMRDTTKQAMDALDAGGGPISKVRRPTSESRATSRAVIKGVHELFDNHGDAALYFIDEVGQPAWFPGTKLHNASGTSSPTAHTLSEHLTRNISLPDPSEVNRVMGRLHRYGKVKHSNPAALTNMTRRIMMKVWTPAALFSAAWPFKVISEEQMRMWWKGLNSAFNDPLQFIAGITLGKIDPKNSLKAYDIMGNDLRKIFKENPDEQFSEASAIANQYRSAMSRGHNGYLGPQTNVEGLHKSFKIKKQGEDVDFYDDWAGVELSTLANDQIVSRIAREGPESVKRWFWSDPEGQRLRYDLSLGMPDARDGKMLMEDKNFADVFIDSYNARLHIKTGGTVDIIPGGGYIVRQPGHQDLIGVVRDGKYKLGSSNFSLRPEDPNYNPNGLGEVLERKYADFAPPVIKGVGPTRINRGEDPQLWERAINGFFDVAMSKPTNFLSRSPAFDQNFWSEVNRLVPYLDESSRATLGKTAKKVKRDVDLNQPFADEPTRLTLPEVEELAANHAADQVKNLLYDNSKRLQWAEASRQIFPFAEAWVEINRTWMRLFAENPEKIRRLQQGLTAARNEGYISVDEESGEQYYNIPGAGLLEDVFGIDEGPLRNMFTGSVDAWNPLQGAYMPGIGPMVQMPMSYLMPKTSDWDWARDMLLPFGINRVEDFGDVAEMGLPRGIQKFVEAITFDEKDSSRQAGMVADIFNQLIMSGEFETATPEDQIAALDKARRIAKQYDMIRAVGSFLVPGTPRFHQQAKDQKGKWLFVEAIGNKYRKIQNEDGDEAADDWLVEEFSLTSDQLFTGATLAVQRRPTTESGWAFWRDHPEVFENLPNTGYYLFPDDPQDAFEQEAWGHQFEEGSRVILTPEQKLISKNQQEAYDFRNEALTVLLESGITPQSEKGRELLRMIDDLLKEEFPGYGKTNVGVPERADVDTMMDELRGWRELDGPVQDSRTWQSVVEFMDLFDGAQAIVSESRGFTTLESTSDPFVISTRQAIYEYGEELAAEDPGFAALWRDFLVHAVLTRQDELGMEEDEPFDQLHRRLSTQGILPETNPEPQASILGA